MGIQRIGGGNARNLGGTAGNRGGNAGNLVWNARNLGNGGIGVRTRGIELK